MICEWTHLIYYFIHNANNSKSVSIGAFHLTTYVRQIFNAFRCISASLILQSIARLVLHIKPWSVIVNIYFSNLETYLTYKSANVFVKFDDGGHKKRLEGGIEIRVAVIDDFLEIFPNRPHHISNVSPEFVQGCDLHMKVPSVSKGPRYARGTP